MHANFEIEILIFEVLEEAREMVHCQPGLPIPIHHLLAVYRLAVEEHIRHEEEEEEEEEEEAIMI
jgi:hypothetical protein